MDFKQAYKFPLKYDGGVVWTADNNLAFNFSDKIISENPADLTERVKEEIVNAINGVFDGYLSELDYNDKGGIITEKGKDIILIRGWGHLTGSGGLNLPEDTATRLQDEFAEYIIKQLS